ncbi:uncharacterized protein BP01DRAFT_70345 [Aspergillus saccharolyticus JOP 1030-1]|uniref:Uncharacterized protein n=1 Tax=Aspergillus saccharolyticus JOP 1030-1 TaxID=1450539 RepID=A0A318ZWX0_9EURO|nr:hypothetical protein BP01DRAFT_70345 [Aspergillus saccharolyticus JOP 1030-1]PYH44628.1 hypothetical protein BP01DRAFT_70345 [Aspergillus saccharolyticus JOP 1030-1]
MHVLRTREIQSLIDALTTRSPVRANSPVRAASPQRSNLCVSTSPVACRGSYHRTNDCRTRLCLAAEPDLTILHLLIILYITRLARMLPLAYRVNKRRVNSGLLIV